MSFIISQELKLIVCYDHWVLQLCTPNKVYFYFYLPV